MDRVSSKAPTRPPRRAELRSQDAVKPPEPEYQGRPGRRASLPSNDTALGPGDEDPPQWTQPSDGVLRGPELSAPLVEDSLGLVLIRALRRHGQKEALVDAVTGEGMTYRGLVRESVCMARALRVLLKDMEDEVSSPNTANSAGNGPVQKDKALGEREADGEQLTVVVGVFVENRKELLPSLVANLLIGVPVTMLNPLSNMGELVQTWTAARPSVALCSWRSLASVLEASRSLPSLRHVVVFPSGVGTPEEDAEDAAAATADVDRTLHVVAYTELLKRVPQDAAILDGEVDLEELIGDVLRPVTPWQHTAYLLQCGRGGRIARLTHRNLHYTVQLLLEPNAAGYGWTPDDVLLLGAPLSHAFGLGVCLGALALGLKVVIMPYFREQLFLSAVQTHKVSQLVLVPAQAALLAHSPLLEDAAVVEGPRGLAGLRELRGVVCAAAPLPRALHRGLTRRLAAPCRQAYGLTQASCSLLVAPPGAPPDTQGSVVPGAEAKVVDVSGGKQVTLGPLQVGELYLRAPSIMAGYLSGTLTRSSQLDDDDQDAEGWLRTGDLAYYDRNGYVFVVDRLKDVALYTRGHFKEFDNEHD